MLCCTCLDRYDKCLFTLPVLSPLQVFAFDHCFWSMDESNVPKYAGESQMLILNSTTKESNHVPCKDLLSFEQQQQQHRETSYLMMKAGFASCKAKRDVVIYSDLHCERIHSNVQ